MSGSQGGGGGRARPATVAIGPSIEPFGDSGWLVTYGDVVDLALNRRVHALAAEITTSLGSSPSWATPVPGYASLVVPYDPLRVPAEQALADLSAIVRAVDARTGGAGQPGRGAGGAPGPGRATSPPIEIPVRYGGADGPDLPDVAALLGLDEAEVVALHAGRVYTVFMLGFMPGFPYLGPLPERLVLPRRGTPRTAVPAGSVAIAARQTGIYPASTPGGWHLIGRTDAALWNPDRDPPALLAPGASVKFVPL